MQQSCKLESSYMYHGVHKSNTFNSLRIHHKLLSIHNLTLVEFLSWCDKLFYLREAGVDTLRPCLDLQYEKYSIIV